MTIRLLSGDCRDVLPTLPAESVQCVVTSPPYYGLRDYGTALWDGGDAGCQHVGEVSRTGPPGSAKQASNYGANGVTSGDCCRCGAVRVDRQIGLEATPDLYLQTMVGVFREIRRVLRKDGTCWVNVGDSYSGGKIGRGDQDRNQRHTDGRNPDNASLCGAPFVANRKVPEGAKPKDLLLMPARLALALQSDGWWVRSAIVWAKPNPMPESVTDRPTSTYEMVYLLTCSARYFYDADAVRERVGEETRRNTQFRGESSPYIHDQAYNNASGIVNYAPAGEPSLAGRSCRNVWTIATSPFSAAHFATFPPELAERCIKAGTSERGCCAACGKPWGRVTERQTVRQLADAQGTWAERPGVAGYGEAAMTTQRCDATSGLSASNSHNASTPQSPSVTTTGWSPGCKCDAGVVPCTVLDPFAGAGTTLLVADRLQRDAIGIELNTAYTEMAMERVRADAPLLTSFPPAEDPEDERMADLFQDMAAD